jgi:hypothetical protein
MNNSKFVLISSVNSILTLMILLVDKEKVKYNILNTCGKNNIKLSERSKYYLIPNNIGDSLCNNCFVYEIDSVSFDYNKFSNDYKNIKSYLSNDDKKKIIDSTHHINNIERQYIQNIIKNDIYE